MTYLYPAGNIKFTVFEDPGCLLYLQEHGIRLTADIRQADVFILRSLTPDSQGSLNEWVANNSNRSRTVLVWTHEPRLSITDKKIIHDRNCDIHIMNVYTGDVYFSNFTFYGSNADRLLSSATNVTFSERPVAGLATYRFEHRQTCIFNGIDIDLSIKRQALFLEARNVGLADIYGKGWPAPLSIPESRGPGWHHKKLDILKKYQFNICMENTAFPHYCTEKIWDSIKSYCLPVYAGFNNKIYDTFPPDSFIDYSEFSNHEELLLYIKNIPKQDYLERLNRCIKVFNEVFTTVNFRYEKQRALDAIIEKILSIIK